jgi:type I restriction-modification system DNA methylase subunit
MPTDHRAELAKVRTFPSLVRYLRDEMDWPIQVDDFDELTFEYSPEELGIDTANAAKIQEIKRLRPLSPKQPWGIFFVKFEPKQLPVVALRRILSQVALKKRASANSAERAAWAADDLLFVSNYGVGDERQISFAHFSKAQDGRDLPTLKVLGWDNRDTALHLDAVVRGLTEHLAWPDDDTDVDAWRRRWRAVFTVQHGEVVTTSKELSIRLAKLASDIRGVINAALAIETETGPLTKLMRAFRDALVHDLDADGFADMYAQTIAYGLLSARIADPEKKTADDFAAHMRTNPFLRELMETFLKVGGRRGKAGGPGIDFDELGVSEVVQLLDDANMEAVVDDFGDKNPQEDPVIHFYELFLKEYDPKKRMQRGVFYTPRPVVSYIVRSVDELLRSEFGLEDGLADTTSWGEMAKRHKDLKIPEGVPADQAFVQILDPATGTGTFLVEGINLIHETLVAKWKAQGHSEKKIEVLWNEYVPNHLLPRLHGYELLMAPYAIAHLKIGLKLYETGYRFGSNERARIYLTNALEPAHDYFERFEFAIPALAHEVRAANESKLKGCPTVVIANPPYAGRSWNLAPELRRIVEPYRFIAGEKIKEKGALQLEKSIQDDYIKFVRLAETILAAASVGICGYVTSHGFLDNPTLRGMRYSLLQSFPRLDVVNMHGNVSRREKCPDGTADENVFEISKTGTAVSLFRRPSASVAVEIRVGDLWGQRASKYRWLVANTVGSTHFDQIKPRPPLFLFLRQDIALSDEYNSWSSVAEMIPIHSKGVVTGRDAFVLDFEEGPLLQRMGDFIDRTQSDQELIARYNLNPTAWWKVSDARKHMPPMVQFRNFVKKVLYRPFDFRVCFYHPAVFMSPRYPVMQHFDNEKRNLLLITSRMTKGEAFAHVTVSSGLAEAILLSSKTSNNAILFPLYVYAEKGARDQSLLRSSGPQPAFTESFLSRVGSALGVEVLRSSRGDLDKSVGPEDLFDFVVSVLHSVVYRKRYQTFLSRDFPRIPVTNQISLFRSLIKIGSELVALHLMKSPKLDHFITSYTGPRNPEVSRVGWSDDTVWLDAAATKKGEPATPGSVGFGGVPEGVWNFHIGGYQVCEKWLKDRKGRTLSADDVTHYQKIIVALAETIRLMKEIDEVIEAHGGWPGAFQPVASADTAAAPRASATALPASS